MNPISQITEFLPRYVCLFYVDYRDSLDEHEDIQEKCLRSNSLESLYEKSFEWYESQEQENLEEYMDETRRNMEKAGLSGLFKEHEEQIRDLIYERNDSNPAKEPDTEFLRHQSVLFPRSRNRRLQHRLPGTG